MTAWSAKVLRSAICLSEKGRTSVRRMCNRPIATPLAKQRCNEIGPDRGFAESSRPPETRFGVSGEIDHECGWFLGRSMLAQEDERRRDRSSPAGDLGIDPYRLQVQDIAVDTKTRASVASHSSRSILRDHIQHRLNIGRRAGNDTQNFARRSLLLQRFLEFVGTTERSRWRSRLGRQRFRVA